MHLWDAVFNVLNGQNSQAVISCLINVLTPTTVSIMQVHQKRFGRKNAYIENSVFNTRLTTLPLNRVSIIISTVLILFIIHYGLALETVRVNSFSTNCGLSDFSRVYRTGQY